MLEKIYVKSTLTCKVTFSLPLEACSEAETVQVLGDFNEWDENGGFMDRSDAGFETTLELNVDKRYEFRYLIDGEIWENDWNADAYVPSPFGVDNSVVICAPIDQLNPSAGK